MKLDKMQKLTKGIKDIHEETNADSLTQEEANDLNRQGIEEYKAQNLGRAFEFFLKAAENGDAWGMYNVGTAYRDGEGVQASNDKAFYWIKKAAHNGIVDAMFETGKMYYRGEGVTKDAVQSFSWCKKAADSDHVWAMNWVGHFYNDGEGVIQNYSEAVFWHKKAADLGNLDSMKALGLMYVNGNGVERNIDTAIEYLEAAYKKDEDDIDNIYVLGMLYDLRCQEKEFNGDWDSFTENQKMRYKEYRKMERFYIEKASEAGHEKAKLALNEIEHRGDLCFITTAVCGSFGKSDDCYELTAFRNFRDGWLRQQSDGEFLIAQYYQIAPTIVEHINLLPDAKEIYHCIWDKYLKSCLDCLKKAQYQRCKQIYIEMVESLEKTYG